MITIELWKWLHDTRCAENGNIRTHFDNMRTMWEELAGLGATISEPDFSSIILGSLPKSYDQFISAVTTTASVLKQELNPEELMQAIIDEYDCQSTRPGAPKEKNSDVDSMLGEQIIEERLERNQTRMLSVLIVTRKDIRRPIVGPRVEERRGKAPKQKKRRKKRSWRKHWLILQRMRMAFGWLLQTCQKVRIWLTVNLTTLPFQMRICSSLKMKMKMAMSWISLLGSNNSWRSPTPPGVLHIPTTIWTISWMPKISSIPLMTNKGPSLWSIIRIRQWSGNKSILVKDQDWWTSEAWRSHGILAFGHGLHTWSGKPIQIRNSIVFILTPTNSSCTTGSEKGSPEGSITSFSDKEMTDLMIDEDEDGLTTFDAAMLVNVEGCVEGVQTELYDSGTSQHMSPYWDHLKNYAPIAPKSIIAADKCHFQAIGKGDLRIKILNNHSMTTILLKDVLRCLDMGLTLISIGKITAAGYKVIFRGLTCRIYDSKDKVIGKLMPGTGCIELTMKFLWTLPWQEKHVKFWQWKSSTEEWDMSLQKLSNRWWVMEHLKEQKLT